MKKTVSAVLAGAFLLVAGWATAGEITGVIKTVNAANREITVEAGTPPATATYTWPLTGPMDMAPLVVGNTITLEFTVGQTPVNNVSKVTNSVAPAKK